MGKTSAGLLMFRMEPELQVFLAHPGGPWWRKKDAGAWSVPKGEPEEGETPEETARREFVEEVGIEAPAELIPLGSITQKGGKTVHAWAFEGDWDPEQELCCNHFEMEWPPRSGTQQSFPEIDKVEFFSVSEAHEKINSAQIPLIDRLVEALG